MKQFNLGLKPFSRPLKLKFHNYADRLALPQAPASQDWGLALQTPWEMYANDKVGDCFFAMAGHAFMCWTANAQGNQALFTDQQILDAYHQCVGPGDPGTDPSEGLKYLQATGIAGHKFGPCVSIDPGNQSEVMLACWLFGGLFVGVELPEGWESTHAWDVYPSGDPDGAIAGGHAVWASGYDVNNGLTLVSWGDEYLIAWDALAKYSMGVVGSVPPDWIADTSLAPSGFDLEALLADEKAL